VIVPQVLPDKSQCCVVSKFIAVTLSVTLTSVILRLTSDLLLSSVYIIVQFHLYIKAYGTLIEYGNRFSQLL